VRGVAWGFQHCMPRYEPLRGTRHRLRGLGKIWLSGSVVRGVVQQRDGIGPGCAVLCCVVARKPSEILQDEHSDVHQRCTSTNAVSSLRSCLRRATPLGTDPQPPHPFPSTQNTEYQSREITAMVATGALTARPGALPASRKRTRWKIHRPPALPSNLNQNNTSSSLIIMSNRACS
jgi:hypothetical protein